MLKISLFMRITNERFKVTKSVPNCELDNFTIKVLY